MSELQDLFIIS